MIHYSHNLQGRCPKFLNMPPLVFTLQQLLTMVFQHVPLWSPFSHLFYPQILSCTCDFDEEVLPREYCLNSHFCSWKKQKRIHILQSCFDCCHFVCVFWCVSVRASALCQVIFCWPITDVDAMLPTKVDCRGCSRSCIGPRADAGADKMLEEGVGGAESLIETAILWCGWVTLRYRNWDLCRNSHGGAMCRSGLPFLFIPFLPCLSIRRKVRLCIFSQCRFWIGKRGHPIDLCGGFSLLFCQSDRYITTAPLSL